MSKSLNKLKSYAKKTKQNLSVLYLAYKNKKTPWYSKLFALLVVAYALSPIDFIPDFIPVLGYLDDLILVPLGILLALKMIPSDVLQESRMKAGSSQQIRMSKSWITATVIILTWTLLACLMGGVIYYKFH